MKPMKARELIRYVESKGWVHVGTTGSHMQFSKKGYRLTIVGPANNIVSPGVVRTVKNTVKEVG